MSELTCRNPDCRISETGKCVEGLDISECPHQQIEVLATEVLAPEVITNIPETKPEPEQVDVIIASGDILSINDATDVLRAGSSRVITVIGPQDAGKTTFGLSLYDAFQNGPFNDYNFAGSLTLPAFEQRCHNARAESRRARPETPRTSLSDGLGFLHLAVNSSKTGRVDLLISDRAGEYYASVANSEENCDSLHEVSRADYVLFMLDGKKLISDERHGIKHDLSMTIATLVENSVLSTTQQVGIVLTKYDYIVTSDKVDQAVKEFDELINTIKGKFCSKLGEIKSFKIAARSENEKVEMRFGVFDVLEECLRPISRVTHLCKSSQPLDRSYHQLPVII